MPAELESLHLYYSCNLRFTYVNTMHVALTFHFSAR
jgi:hypothetical protein